MAREAKDPKRGAAPHTVDRDSGQRAQLSMRFRNVLVGVLVVAACRRPGKPPGPTPAAAPAPRPPSILSAPPAAAVESAAPRALIDSSWPLEARAKPVTGAHAMVVSSHYLATQVGVSMLQRGGNAVDAAVAVAF